MKVVNVSPKGQITIPTEFRKKMKVKQYAFEMQGNTIVLKPVKIQIIEHKKEDYSDLSALSIESFKFWDDPSNDVYEKLL